MRGDKGRERSPGLGSRDPGPSSPDGLVSPCTRLDSIPSGTRGLDQKVPEYSPASTALLHMPPHQPGRREAGWWCNPHSCLLRLVFKVYPTLCFPSPASCLGFTEIVPHPQKYICGTMHAKMTVANFVFISIPVHHLLLFHLDLIETCTLSLLKAGSR